MNSLKIAAMRAVMKLYRVPDDGVLAAVDGVWYHSPEKMRRDRCLHMTKDEVTAYYHGATAAAIVKPHITSVIPVTGGMITNEDGTKKRDCGLTAAKRRLPKRLDEIKELNATVLGDDLYSHYPFCKQITDNGLSFVFTCEQKTHPWLAETVKYPYLTEQTGKERKGKRNFLYTYRYLNNVPIRGNKETLMVNYTELEIKERDSGGQAYYCGWITNKTIDGLNARHLADCAGTRRKIENLPQ